MKRALLLATVAILLLIPVSQVCAAPKPFYDGRSSNWSCPPQPEHGYYFYGR